MKLEYRILWFDDQKSSIDPAVNRINGQISRLGFEPKIDLRIVSREMEDPLADIPNEEDVDLVMMDWKLGGPHDGAKLTRRLRHKFRYTDVIFYSSESAKKLRELIYAEDLDGVFCFSRAQLGDRVGSLIQGQLRRVLDIDHMRGIVMAATSDLDHGMIDCLEAIRKISYADNPNELSDLIAESIIDSSSKKIAEIDRFRKNGRIERLIRDPSLGATQRLQILLREIDKIADRLTEPHIKTQLESYQGEIITPRNDFAHRKASRVEGKILFEGRDNPYDQDAMRELRLRILKHSDNLSALLSTLADIADNSGQPAVAEKLAGAQDTIETVIDLAKRV